MGFELISRVRIRMNRNTTSISGHANDAVWYSELLGTKWRRLRTKYSVIAAQCASSKEAGKKEHSTESNTDRYPDCLSSIIVLT